MRVGRRARAAAVVVMVAAGCQGADDRRDPTPSPAMSTEVTAPTLPARPLASARDLPPAAAAGGVCREISFDRVAAVTGIRFDIAGASGRPGDTQTCALQPLRGTVPDLVFSSIPVPEGLTSEEYAAGYVPRSAAELDGIGRAGYSRIVTGVQGAGPRVEIGWWGTGRVYTLSVTTVRTTNRAAAAGLVPKLVALGRDLAG